MQVSTETKNKSEIEVSIICLAYNHEKYIRDALEGFLMQRTSFPFEIIVHDDASCDRTQEIVKEYQEKYPDIIVPFFEEENQYSKGTWITRLCLGVARGNYIAICEGDDYWIDPNKLQMQYELMVSDPECTFVFANAKRIDAVSGVDYGEMIASSDISSAASGAIGVREIDRFDFVPTATFFIPKKTYLEIPLPPEGTFRGDRYIQLVATALGHARYLNRVVSVYRWSVPGSAMTTRDSTFEAKRAAALSYCKMYDFFDETFDYRFHDEISDGSLKRKYVYMLLRGDRSVMSRKESMRVARSIGVKEVLKVSMFRLFPELYLRLSKKVK